jgi:hypothetical protein
MAPQTVGKPRAVELLQIAVGGVAGLVGGSLAGVAVFQSAIMALVGGMGGAVFGLIAALKGIEGEDGRARQATAGSDRPPVMPPAPDAVRQAKADPRLTGRSAA